MEAKALLPTISVVLPTYNRLPLLREAVASVLNQEFDGWELLLVDDGSDDGTVEWVRSIDDPRILLIETPHCAAPARLRNKAGRVAKGSYIAFLDSDDIWMPKKLAYQLQALRDADRARWSYTDSTQIDAEGNQLNRSKFKQWVPISGWITKALLVHDALVSLPTVLLERSLFEQVGGFDESLKYCEDYELWLRLAARAEVLAIPRALTSIRVHRDSSTWGRVEVTATFAQIYERYGARHPSQKVKTLCRNQQQEYSLYCSYQLLASGQRRQAWENLVAALRLAPARFGFWRKFAKLSLLTLRRFILGRSEC